MIYRKATPSDWQGLNELMRQLCEKTAEQHNIVPVLEKISSQSNYYLGVAEDDTNGKLCATVMGIVCDDICGACQPFLVIENVVTLQEYRGRGIGRKLVEHVENWGRENNCQYSFLVSGVKRAGSHKFYAAIGYDEVKGFKKYSL